MTSNNSASNESIDATSVSMTTGIAGTMIGFSAAIITLIVTLKKPEDFAGAASIKYILIFYILAIIFLIFSTDSFILSAWDKKNFITWGTIGSIAYGLGMCWFIIGISLTFDILINLTQVAYLTITLFLLMYIVHYYLRWRIKKEDPYTRERIATRALMMLQIFIGYVLIYTLD